MNYNSYSELKGGCFMEKETGYIEKLIKNICADKNRMFSLIFNTLSVICTILYLTAVATSGIHFIFVLSMLLAAGANMVYVLSGDVKIKYADNIVVYGIALLVIGLILKVVRVGITFSIVYFTGYLVYALAFLLLCLYCTRNETKPKVIRILLIVCVIWSIYEFFSLNSTFVVGITWKIFRVSEVFLCIGYLYILRMVEKSEIPFADKVGEFKKQIPCSKICISILLIISIVSIIVGFVVDMSKVSTAAITEQKATTKNSTVTQAIQATEKPKKSTVTSTVISVESEPKVIEEIKIGDTVETDGFAFKLNRVELSSYVQPDNPPSYYTYYQAESEHTYIYVNASITNKEKHPLECDEIYSVTADFDGGYTYTGFNIADDSDGDFSYANITSVEPLETLGVHCLVDCPRVVEEEGKPLFITITLKNGSKYKYTIK